LISSQFDILVIGSGAAGLYAALCLPTHWRIALITKDTLKTGASDWAQGGIAAAMDPSDSALLHLEDTLKAGAGICDKKAVEFLVDNAGNAIASLLKMGVAFDRHGENLALTLEAAHSRPRVLHAADTTGRAIVSTLTAKVLERPNIKTYQQALALNLWLNPDTGKCQGVSLLYQNQIIWLKAEVVILATGGGGQVFARTTNPAVSTGDGVALAWRAGALLRDLEFFQFHPTALAKEGAPYFLISEAVRGEGAHLVDEEGRRFAFDYHPDGELAPRDVVSRAIFSHLQKKPRDPAHDRVFLDLRSIPPDRISYRFPNIIKVCKKWGIDVFNEPIPVVPAAHYWMGGIAVNLMSSASIDGLYAIGETASTGVHGANRLASNSLLECLVFAAQLAKIEIPKSEYIEEKKPLLTVEEDWSEEIPQIASVRDKLPVLMWQSAGISRSQEILDKALIQVKSWREELAQLKISQYLLNLSPNQTVYFNSTAAEEHLKISVQTMNLLDIAYLILQSAAFRTESRGGHYRIDYPGTSPQWQGHTLVQGDRIWKSSEQII
jgi:L-aspartate oxidase